MTGKHAFSSSCAENVCPETQGVHAWSVVLEPAADKPSPAGHVCHGSHDALPPLAANCPGGHEVQLRLPVAEKVPAGQSAQASLPDTAARPALHSVHTPLPSAAAWPAWHTMIRGVPSQEWPPGHALQTRSDVCVGNVASYSARVSHRFVARHTRSLVPVGAAPKGCRFFTRGKAKPSIKKIGKAVWRQYGAKLAML